MASVFTMIINGELPARIVWKDEQCVAFLTINPLTPGHTLVVPRQETDEWTDLGPELWSHLSGVAYTIGGAIREGFDYARVGVVIAGFEVPHAHIHVFGADTMAQFDFSRVDPNPDAAALDAAAATITATLRARGTETGVP